MKYKGRVTHTDLSGNKYPIVNATIVDGGTGTGTLGGGGQSLDKLILSDDQGCFTVDLPTGIDSVQAMAFGQTMKSNAAKTDSDLLLIDYNFGLSLTPQPQLYTDQTATAGKHFSVTISSSTSSANPLKIDATVDLQWSVAPSPMGTHSSSNGQELTFVIPPSARHLRVETVLKYKGGSSNGDSASTSVTGVFAVLPADITSVTVQDPISVRLQRTASEPTLDQALWAAIEDRTEAISFHRYQEFMNRALNWEERNYRVPKMLSDPALQNRIQGDLSTLGTDLQGVRAYQTLKALTETFLLLECGVRIDPKRSPKRSESAYSDESRQLDEPFTVMDIQERLKTYMNLRGENILPSVARVVENAFPEVAQEEWTGRLIGARINEPCLIELIWCYWMEQGMLVQTINALCQRFQNMRPYGSRNALLNLQIDPLRPLGNLLFGFIQDGPNRLTVSRRAHAYVDAYGDYYKLSGKAVGAFRPAESRTQFMEAFHNLMRRAGIFFKEDFQTTVIADGYPLLKSLQEVHLILAQSDHNQTSYLCFTARAEMMLMQFMLARREARDFLQSSPMVPYKEAWEPQVDAMKTIQGWSPESSIKDFRDLAVYGERILLSIRLADWTGTNREESAKNWVRKYREQILSYAFSFQAVTGIDLMAGDPAPAAMTADPRRTRMAMQLRAR